MISLAALRWGTGADVVAGSLEPDPKISARRSWVDGPDDAPFEGGVTVVSLSPIRSTIESLSVLVEPTGLRSLTECQLGYGWGTELTGSHHSSPDFWGWHPLHNTRLDLILRKQTSKLDRPLLNLQLQITRESS